ncbi:hypothetical protein GCM10022409_34710 [Hymenobacter glaciei]|uniref:Uncharacterized protein n=1 Tax=Hymenobacter glaciei TaxID=877209 RepID=A0ABP7UMG4_9BACT
MPSKTFYLDDARTEPLTASWGFLFRNFTVSYAGNALEPTNPEATIAQGRQYRLPDGRIFSAQHKQNSYPQEMELLIEGQPVPGSGTHPQERIKQAWYALLFIGVMSIGFGLWAELGQVAVLLQNSIGWGSFGEGIIFVALGWLGYYRRSALALTIALVILVVESLLSIGSSLAMAQSAALGGVVIRLFFCLTVYRGMKAARLLRAEDITLTNSST